ncbi:MAG: DUF4259 domain-containing protein [Terriglobales bacterium]|jgi:hypothetical protein
MGAWGKLPWDNDGAADWFDDLFKNTKLAKRVEDTLKLDVENSHQEIRAAASVLLFLGHVYIWPVHDLNGHLALAADRLEEVSRLDVIAESPELVEEILAEIQELRSRIKTQGTSQPPPPPPRKWWQFWT